MKKILLAILVLTLQLQLVAQNPSKLQKNMEALLVDAVQLFEDGRFEEAKERLSVIADADPTNDAAYYYLGLSEYYIGNAKDAEVALREAVRLDPENFWYRDRLAALYSMTGKENLTINIYEGLLEDYPKKTEIYYNLVNLYARQNRLDKVIETLDHIETVSGRSESTVLARYDILMHQNRIDDAFKLLEEFNEEWSSPQILCMMGDAKLTDYKDSLALEYYEEALALDPESVPALIGKSEVYRIRRSYDEYFDIIDGFVSSPTVMPEMKSQYLSNLSEHIDPRFFQNYNDRLDSLYEKGLRMHPQDSSMLLTAGTYFFRSDRKDKANSIFKENCNLYPKNFNAAAMYLQALNFSEDWETLAEESARIFKDFPDEPAFLNMTLMAHFNLEDYTAVIKDAELMAAAFPKDTSALLQAYSSIGDCYHLTGEEKAAFKAYEKALKIDPDYAPVLNNYAYYLCLGKKKLGKALAMSKKTVDQNPDNATYLDTFAWILHLQGKSQEAKTYFKHAMLYGGKESATMLDHYAEVLYALGEYDLAGVYWNMAKQKNTDNEITDLDARVEARLNAIKK